MSRIFPERLPENILHDPKRAAERAMYEALRQLPEFLRVRRDSTVRGTVLPVRPRMKWLMPVDSRCDQYSAAVYAMGRDEMRGAADSCGFGDVEKMNGLQ